MHVRPPIRNTQYAIRIAHQARALPRGTSRLLLVRDHLLHQGQLHPGLYLELLPHSLRVGLLGRLGRQLLKVRGNGEPGTTASLGGELRHELQNAPKGSFRTSGESREAHTGEHFVLAACVSSREGFVRVLGGRHERQNTVKKLVGLPREHPRLRMERRVCQPSPSHGDSLALSYLADEV